MPEVVVDGVADRVLLERRLPGPQPGEVRGPAVVHDQLADQGEQRCPQVVDVLDLLHAHAGDIRPPPGRHHDHALALELGQRLAHRRAAGAEPPGQLDGVQPVAGQQPALDDGDRDLVEDVLRQRRPLTGAGDALQHQRAPIADRVRRPERVGIFRWRHDGTLAVPATPLGRAVPYRDRAAGSVKALRLDWHWTSSGHRLRQPEHRTNPCHPHASVPGYGGSRGEDERGSMRAYRRQPVIPPENRPILAAKWRHFCAKIRMQ